jgi:hypothetical protein
MSEDVQRRARARRDAAQQRELTARERARRNAQRGDAMLARVHKHSAEAHADAAAAAERLRLADVTLEGERLGEPTPAESERS